MSQSLDRALRILPLLATGPATLDETARHIDAHKTTAMRLLRTLHQHGLVHRQDDERYRLGAQLFALAHEAAAQLDVREIARPHLERLNERTGHTVHLAMRDEDEVRYIDKRESHYPVRMHSRIGRPVAVTVAAVAKVLLADLPPRERRAVATRLDYPRYTPRSVTGPAALLAELGRVNEQGWASDFGGHEESINCLAAPVRGHDGRAVAAVSVSAPSVVADEQAVLALLPLVREAARAITDAYTGRSTLEEGAPTEQPAPPHRAPTLPAPARPTSEEPTRLPQPVGRPTGRPPRAERHPSGPPVTVGSTTGSTEPTERPPR